MGITRVRAGGAWSTPTACWVQDQGSWKAAKALYVARLEAPQNDTDPPLLHWTYVQSLRAPDMGVAGVYIDGPPVESLPAGQTAPVRVGWPLPHEESWESHFQVSVTFYNHGLPAGGVTAAPMTGHVEYQASNGDVVHAVVRYVNNMGAGPETTTAAVSVGA